MWTRIPVIVQFFYSLLVSVSTNSTLYCVCQSRLLYVFMHYLNTPLTVAVYTCPFTNHVCILALIYQCSELCVCIYPLHGQSKLFSTSTYQIGQSDCLCATNFIQVHCVLVTCHKTLELSPLSSGTLACHISNEPCTWTCTYLGEVTISMYMYVLYMYM